MFDKFLEAISSMLSTISKWVAAKIAAVKKFFGFGKGGAATGSGSEEQENFSEEYETLIDLTDTEVEQTTNFLPKSPPCPFITPALNTIKAAFETTATPDNDREPTFTRSQPPSPKHYR